METQIIIQGAILLLTLVMLWAAWYLPKRGLTNPRTRTRASLQTKRHLIQASRLLARARTSTNRTHPQSLAKTALMEADAAIALSPNDASPRVLRALALDLLGHRTAALRSLDSALVYPRAKSLEAKERADALMRRAELKMAVNRRRRVESAIEDLEEAVRLAGDGAGGSGDSARMFNLMGECYEFKGLKEKARWAFLEALKAQPNLATARDGLARIGS